MTRILAATLILLSVGGIALAQSTTQLPPGGQMRGKFATTADRDVLQALLLRAVNDKDFPAPADANKQEIVLHQRTPEMIEPVISASVVNFDTGGRILPKDAWDDLVRRNAVRLDPHSREIHYEGLTFAPLIQVGDAFPGPKPPFQGKTFAETFPQARGWVDAWVPGYSKDGKTAVVRARVGPTAKWAMLTAILKQEGGKWSVAWLRY